MWHWLGQNNFLVREIFVLVFISLFLYTGLTFRLVLSRCQLQNGTVVVFILGCVHQHTFYPFLLDTANGTITTPYHFSLCGHSCVILSICPLTPWRMQCFHSSPYISWQSEYDFIGKRPIAPYKTLQQPDPYLSLQIHLILPLPCSLHPGQTYLLSDTGMHYAAFRLTAFCMLFPLPRMPWYSCPSVLHILASLMLIFPDLSSRNPSSENPSLVFQKRLVVFLAFTRPIHSLNLNW